MCTCPCSWGCTIRGRSSLCLMCICYMSRSVLCISNGYKKILKKSVKRELQSHYHVYVLEIQNLNQVHFCCSLWLYLVHSYLFNSIWSLMFVLTWAGRHCDVHTHTERRPHHWSPHATLNSTEDLSKGTAGLLQVYFRRVTEFWCSSASCCPEFQFSISTLLQLLTPPPSSPSLIPHPPFSSSSSSLSSWAGGDQSYTTLYIYI